MSDNDFSWSDLRQQWNESAKKEAPERASWMTPEMWSINTMLSDIQRDVAWHLGHCDHPNLDETVIGWNPGDVPFRCKREQDYRKWTAFVDGDAWPISPPLVWRREPLPQPPKEP